MWACVLFHSLCTLPRMAEETIHQCTAQAGRLALVCIVCKAKVFVLLVSRCPFAMVFARGVALATAKPG